MGLGGAKAGSIEGISEPLMLPIFVQCHDKQFTPELQFIVLTKVRFGWNALFILSSITQCCSQFSGLVT
jgi:hypothetical protein